MDSENKPYRLDQQIGSLQEVYNSPWIRDVRRKMCAGEKVSACQRCYTEEEAGVRSARQAWNEKYASIAEEVQKEPVGDGQYHFQARYVDLRLGNLCNLKCRMCNPYASRKWLEDWNRIASLDALDESEGKRLASMDWFKSELFVENLREILGSVEEIYFTGGEPLLINKHFDLLRLLIDEGRAGRIGLKYNTNMTYLPEKVYELWGHFKKVTVNMSIDGVGRVNEYIRHPSVWTEIAANLRRMDDYFQAMPRVRGSIHTTVQMYNLEHLPELFDFVASFKAFQKFPYLNILNHPASLNVRNAPAEFKREITAELTAWQDSHRESLAGENQFKKLQGLIDYLNSSDMGLQSDFLTYTQDIDTLRGENFSAISPRLASALL